MTVKKRLLKIGAALLGSAIVVFLLLMASSVLGDPVSKYIAQKEIERYVEETYPEQQLSVSEVRYNFKFGGYYAEAASDTSIDTRFSVYWRFGEGCSDGYAAVTEGANTFSRMEAEYTKRLCACIQDPFRWTPRFRSTCRWNIRRFCSFMKRKTKSHSLVLLS